MKSSKELKTRRQLTAENKQLKAENQRMDTTIHMLRSDKPFGTQRIGASFVADMFHRPVPREVIERELIHGLAKQIGPFVKIEQFETLEHREYIAMLEVVDNRRADRYREIQEQIQEQVRMQILEGEVKNHVGFGD